MIVSIGEVVWDLFPDRRVLGGAPVNVAYHLQCLGQPLKVISRVGDDALGRETLARLTDIGLPVDGVQVDPKLETGRVNVTVGADDEPASDIVFPAAWDRIDREMGLRSAGDDFCLVFGTLAQRDPCSRAAIRALWPRAARRFYDVNLRPPFTERHLVLDSLTAADVVKVNHDELSVLAGWLELDGAGPDLAAGLCARYDLETVVVTEGRRGAWVLSGGKVFSDPGVPVVVADTVGAGDAFFAAVIDGVLRGVGWPENLATANRRGAYVASCQGATPPMPEQVPGGCLSG